MRPWTSVVGEYACTYHSFLQHKLPRWGQQPNASSFSLPRSRAPGISVAGKIQIDKGVAWSLWPVYQYMYLLREGEFSIMVPVKESRTYIVLDIASLNNPCCFAGTRACLTSQILGAIPSMPCGFCLCHLSIPFLPTPRPDYLHPDALLIWIMLPSPGRLNGSQPFGWIWLLWEMTKLYGTSFLLYSLHGLVLKLFPVKIITLTLDKM